MHSLNYVQARCWMHIFALLIKLSNTVIIKSIFEWGYQDSINLKLGLPKGARALKIYSFVPVDAVVQTICSNVDINQIWLCRDGQMAPPLHHTYTHTRVRAQIYLWWRQSDIYQIDKTLMWWTVPEMVLYRGAKELSTGRHLQRPAHFSPPCQVDCSRPSRELKTHLTPLL